MAKFVLEQHGEIVATVECDDYERAVQEIGRYAYIYGGDGPVHVREIEPRKGLRSAVGGERQ